MYSCLMNMKVLNFQDFMKKHKLKNITMNEFQLQRVFNFNIFSRDSKIHSDKGFVKIDKGSRGGTHWTAFHVKNKSFYSDSFGGQPNKFLLNQLPKPIIYHKYKIQDTNFKLCGSYCLYFLYLIERMNYYDVVLKMCFKSSS